MRSNIFFSTHSIDRNQWIDMPLVPRIGEWINVPDILETKALEEISESAQCWSGSRGTVQTVEYRRDEKGLYVEMYVWCED